MWGEASEARKGIGKATPENIEIQNHRSFFFFFWLICFRRRLLKTTLLRLNTRADPLAICQTSFPATPLSPLGSSCTCLLAAPAPMPLPNAQRALS